MFIFFDSPAWLNGFNILMALIGFIILVGGSIIVLLVRRGDATGTIQKDRAEASEGLLKIRDIELADCNRKCEHCQEELEDVTAELRGQMALDIDKLMSYWNIRDGELARMANLEQENRVLRRRLGEPA